MTFNVIVKIFFNIIFAMMIVCSCKNHIINIKKYWFSKKDAIIILFYIIALLCMVLSTLYIIFPFV